MWCYKMINMNKITRTKLAMLVTLVLLNIFTTIALVYSMTVSNVVNLESGGDPAFLNLSMIFAIIIAFMWVVALILFYEFKTDDILVTHIHGIDTQIKEFKEFKQMLQDTAFPPYAMNSDVLKEGGITGHIVPPK